jgi:hypothetical protein
MKNKFFRGAVIRTYWGTPRFFRESSQLCRSLVGQNNEFSIFFLSILSQEVIQWILNRLFVLMISPAGLLALP